MGNSFPERNRTTVLEVFETLFNRDSTGGTLLVTEPHSTHRSNGGRVIGSPVVGSRNVLKRNAMRFAAAVLVGVASLVAGPNAALAAGPQHPPRATMGSQWFTRGIGQTRRLNLPGR
jgi:hypothetical protein